MSPRRLFAACGVEFWPSFRRPLFIALALIGILTSFGLSSGKMSISSGDTSVGGTRAWITSEFAQTQTMTFIVLLYYAFFIAAAAGLSLLRDREVKVDVLLHSTPMTPGEYVWGRFLAVAGGIVALLGLNVAASAFFNHVVPNANASDMRGPFALGNYFIPMLTIGVPFVVFFTGISMLIGEKSRSAVLVFVVPVAALLISGFFLWTWSPSWLDWRLNRLMQVVEPTAYRWLNETHLKVDRGVDFYNTQSVPYDGLFALNRAWLLVLGLGGVFVTQLLVARSMRGAMATKKAQRNATTVTAALDDAPVVSIPSLGMRSRVPSVLHSAWQVALAELRELRRQPGLYIFVPLILIQTIGNVYFRTGAFDTPLLLTPGITAVVVADQLSVFACLLLLFYTVESLERDRAVGIASILHSTPMRTTALLLGKSVANGVVVLIVVLASLVACAIALAIQGRVSLALGPYVLVWGLLLVPTFLVWNAFVTAAYAATGNRYAAYAVGIAVLAFTGYRALTGGMNWAGNWPMWNAFRWSDLGFYETDRAAVILNRLMVLGFALLFTVIAVRLFGRRGADAVRTMHRLSPGALLRSAAKLSPYAVVPIAACVALLFMVSQGIGGRAAEKADKEYWGKNLKTWLEAPLPDIARLEVRVKVEPKKHALTSAGTLTLINPLEAPMGQIPLSGGLHWKNLIWTMNGAAYQPEDRERLYVFTPPTPLAFGDSVVIQWQFDGRLPGGITKNGGEIREFILPSGVVLTGFGPSFMPVLGFIEQVGETKDNKTDARVYPRDYWQGMTRASYGATAWFPARVTVTGPESYTLNSVGVCTSNTVDGGWRTQVWDTDHPVKIVNIVCGRWDVKQGDGTTVYYNTKHKYNIDEMSATLDAARKYYSEWFYPFPWRELKLSEFPALASYAQGFGTNITFSEQIGFLTKNDAKTDATFLVTAHEAAHQWWGNILTPANGPNGDFLSEGTSHFATLLLFEQVKGARGRMEFAKGLEARYGDRRRADDERAMYDVDGKRDADNTVIYDRGGWVFWMLYDYLGAERARVAYRNFFETWSQSRDHPALQDFVAAMRPYADDPAAYDAFTKQWFEDKVVPQYRLTNAKQAARGDGYDVTFTVENIGTGTMPLEVAATSGERWERADEKSNYTRHPDYKEARTTVVLGAGESKALTIHCAFDPEQLVADPDVRVLQLKRKQAVASL